MTQHKMSHPVLSWLTILGTSLALVLWGAIIHYAIKDANRQWDVGQMMDTPARSTYSTVMPETNANPPTQLPLSSAAQPATATAPATSTTATPGASTREAAP